jgi:lipopolysaccharide export LptBFGC system permease protein LptF
VCAAASKEVPPAESAEVLVAVIAAVATVLSAIIAAWAAVKAVRSRDEIRKAAISLDELLEPKIIEAIQKHGRFVQEGHAISLDELLTPRIIDAIRKHGGFISKEDVLTALLGSFWNPEFPKLQQALIQDSEVSRMIDKSRQEQMDFTIKLLGTLHNLGEPHTNKERPNGN